MADWLQISLIQTMVDYTLSQTPLQYISTLYENIVDFHGITALVLGLESRGLTQEIENGIDRNSLHSKLKKIKLLQFSAK